MKKLLLYTGILMPNTMFAQNEESIYREDIPYTGNVEVVWEKKLGTKIQGSAIIDGDGLFVVIAGGLNNNSGGQMCGLNKNDGNVMWMSDKQDYPPLHGATLDGTELFYTTDRKIVSVEKTSGKTNWAANNPFSMMIGSSCGVFPDVIVAATARGEIFGVARQDGKLLWKTKVSDLDTPPIYSYNNTVVVADGENGVYAFDAATSNKKWEYKSECGEFMTLEGNKAYFGNGDRGFTCLNLDTGKEIWTKDIDDGNPFVNGKKYYCASGFSAAPVIIGDAIYGGDYTHTAAAMNKSTGEILWVDYFPKLNRSELVAYKNGLLLSSEEAITLLNLKGEIVGKYKLPDSMVDKESANAIAVDGDELILTNKKGKVAKVRLIDKK